MKTADIIAHDMICAMDCDSLCMSHDDIKQWALSIQLDALNEAARIGNDMIAMAECEADCPCRHAVKNYQQAILSRAEQLKKEGV